MLLRQGHQVETFEYHSDTLINKGFWGFLEGAALTPWNPFSAEKLKKTLDFFKPDIVHAHNTFPLISPSIFSAARDSARVLTLHNYRLLCPAAIPLRKGVTCTECIDKRSVMPSVRHGCYRSSRAATLPLAINVAFHRWRGTWSQDVEIFIALTDFQKEKFASAGLPRDKIAVKPNFFPGTPSIVKYSERPNRVVVVGRISTEKGIEDVVDAWRGWHFAPELRIIGDGPLRYELEKKAISNNKISFLGSISNGEAVHEISQARLLLIPSRWFEGFPMVLREAFAFGTPVGVSNIGPLPDLVSGADGIIFDAANPTDLRRKVQDRWADINRMIKMSAASFSLFENFYTERINYQMLLEIYKKAIDHRKSAGR
ncbi:glycosyltransferase [Rhodobacterales bacterium LSUCC0031]|nr:glycosyltransferase [Rhodobacterales bacterium LSUCC0031]